MTHLQDALCRTTGQQHISGAEAAFTFAPAGEQTTMRDVTGVTTCLRNDVGRTKE